MKTKIIWLLCIGLMISPLFAQSSGVLTLRTNYFYNFEVYYLLDFDFNNGQNNPEMFSYSLSYTPNDPNGAPIKIKIEFEWIANIPSMNIDNRRILYVLTDPFDLKGQVTLTSRDIDQNFNINYDDGNPLNVNVDRLEQDVQSLQSAILSTGGKLPAGSYVFTLNITDQNDSPLKNQTQTIEVANPTNLELISPGGDLDDNFEIATPLPTFQWESIDFMWSKANCSQCGYSIRVAEYDATRHNSVDQALKDRANLPYPDNGDYYQLPSAEVNSSLHLLTAGTVFQYPLTGAKPLEPGKTYVWQIRKTFPTTSGAEEVLSPIFAFKIQSTGATNFSGIDISQFLAILNQIPDIDPEWFKTGGELFGYVPTGVVTVNGVQRLTMDQLSALVGQLMTGQITVKSITIE